MTSINTTETVALTGQASLEPSIATSHDFTDLIIVTFDSSKMTYNDTVWKLVQPSLPGTGLVRLVDITAVFVCESTRELVKVGTAAVGSSATVDTLGMMRNGIYHRSNEYNTGVKHIESIVIMDTLSRQLNPISASLPTPNLFVSVTSKTVLNLEVRVKVEGIRVSYLK